MGIGLSNSRREFKVVKLVTDIVAGKAPLKVPLMDADPDVVAVHVGVVGNDGPAS
jgi:hypothetical protein